MHHRVPAPIDGARARARRGRNAQKWGPGNSAKEGSEGRWTGGRRAPTQDHGWRPRLPQTVRDPAQAALHCTLRGRTRAPCAPCAHGASLAWPWRPSLAWPWATEGSSRTRRRSGGPSCGLSSSRPARLRRRAAGAGGVIGGRAGGRGRGLRQERASIRRELGYSYSNVMLVHALLLYSGEDGSVRLGVETRAARCAPWAVRVGRWVRRACVAEWSGGGETGAGTSARDTIGETGAPGGGQGEGLKNTIATETRKTEPGRKVRVVQRDRGGGTYNNNVNTARNRGHPGEGKKKRSCTAHCLR